MRLPGTFNLGGRNKLPTAKFLLHYEELKRAQHKAKLDGEANTNNKLEFGDEPFPKTLTTTSKKGGGNDVKKDDKPDDVVITPDGETFTLAQDEALIDLKIKGKTWAEIATELGKEKDALNNRWRDIRPADWEARAAEEEEKKKKKNSGGGGGSGGKKGKGNQNNQNNQDLQQGGGKGNVNNQQQHEGKKGKNNQQDNKAQNKKQQEAQADAGADNGNEAVSDAGTWAVADDNFTEKEVSYLFSFPFLPYFSLYLLFPLISLLNLGKCWC
jgi:hypothetical protein